MLRFVIAGFYLVVALFASAQAQIKIEVSKITCGQFVHGKIGPTRSVGLWLSGFYSGRRDDTNFDLEAFEANLSKVKRFCYAEKNFTVPVMQAFDQIFGRVK
jgi:acid stress chaperone HdeB